MKKIVSLLLLFFFIIQAADACTTFFINKNGQMVFGRNYDWITGNGMICTNQRGLAKTSFKTKNGETISWVSRYGSITFNQYGKEFPTGGMNEKGLVVELMWLDGTVYPKPDNRPALGVLQWVQYQLDNCSTIDELIANDKKIRIADAATPLHYLVADANGNAATIEFLDGKMVVHKGSDLPFPVLTNDRYASSVEQTQAAVNSAGNSSQSFTNNSIDRFARACKMVTRFRESGLPAPVIDYSFHILDEVAQGTHTKWSIVYDITNKKIHFKTLAYPAIKNIAFSAFEFNCQAAPRSWEMNQPAEGDVAGQFRDFSIDWNSRMVNKSFDESISQFTVSTEDRMIHSEYPGSVTCQKAGN